MSSVLRNVGSPINNSGTVDSLFLCFEELDLNAKMIVNIVGKHSQSRQEEMV